MNLSYFNQSNLYQALQRFLAELHVPVNELTAAPATAPDILTAAYNPDNPAHQLVQEVYIAGGVDEAVFQRQAAPLAPEGLKQQRYEGLLIFGVTLKDRANGLLPTRRQLADITRAFNREFQYTPVVVVFRYAQFIAIANAERLSYKQEWREGEKVGKVSLLRDIDVTRPHTGHLKILQELAISRAGKGVVNTFADLYARWQAVFNVALLNKQFYKELSDWYFWALQEVTFPAAGLPNDDEQRKAHTAQNLIRLLTRLLFVWFVKEKHLIPEELFDETYLRDHLLHEFEPRKRKEGDPAARGSRYYRAILQNLFFATLNQTVGKRAFRKDGQQMNVTNLMRYKRYFKDPPAFISLVEACVPFMNGGLFECLDAPDPVRKGKMGGDVIVYEDGFSDRSDNPLCVPDYLFFGVAEHADLSAELGDARRGDVTVNGLITILNSYKFTVTENTPIEEDVALDPELLGRVFENLLASYNPETKTTARKQTGSFYTPREIVNYMVDEALKAYLSQKLETEAGLPPDDAERRLDVLIGYDAAYFQEENRFDDAQTAVLINAIDRCHILDPACGSGAFPMGILHKLVHVLHKLDPDNQLWKQAQKDRAIGEKVAELKRDKALAAQLSDDTVRAQAIRLINDRLRDIETIFDREHQFDDYARKLFLIENCIYGVDIQPIAAQISKLRCFIALIVDQNAAAPARENFGIRPLPNLETKFVAANALIGIEKPQAQGNLFENPRIRELEEQLTDVRHRLFSAQKPAEKRALREHDQQLREEMGALLTGAGWGHATARQLAAWDPYNQNASSPFFDPAWMFGITDGFDVVIGNPPYKSLTKNNTESNILSLYLKAFDSIKKASSKNIFTLFIEQGINLSKNNSVLSFIIPEGLFITRSYKECVEKINHAGSINLIATFEDFVFENAITGNIIFLFTKGNFRVKTRQIHFDKDYNLSEKKEGEDEILKTIVSNDCRELKEMATLFKGMVVSDRSSVVFENKELGRNDIFLLGKSISKYAIIKEYYTHYADLTIAGGTKKKEKHDFYPRILIRRTGDSLCCAFLEKPALTESTLYSCWSNDGKISSKYLLALLNSKLLTYYIQKLMITNKQAFPQILMTDLESLPIKISNNQKFFIDLVDQILAAKQRDPAADTSALEAEIDRLVYALYGLTDEEIAIVGGK